MEESCSLKNDAPYEGEFEIHNHMYCPRTTSPVGVGSFTTSHNSKSSPAFAFSEA